MPTFDTFAQIRTDIIDRAGEDPNDATGNYYATAQRQIVRSYHDICNEHPFLFLRADPPGALRTVAHITTGTIQVTAGSDSITFSSAPSVSVQGRKIIISGRDEYYRITAHTAGQAGATLDVAWTGDTNAAATYTVFQDEYNLVAGVRHIIGMWVAESGVPITQKSEEWIRENCPDPPRLIWPPKYFARIGETRIRFEGYPDRTRRLEYPYTVIPDDIDDAAVTIRVPRNWRYVIADGGLYWTYIVLNDNRADAAGIVYAVGREKLVVDDLRKRMALHSVNGQ